MQMLVTRHILKMQQRSPTTTTHVDVEYGLKFGKSRQAIIQSACTMK